MKSADRRSLTAALATLAALACADDAPTGEDALTARGRQIYRNVCTACHNVDPALDSSIGPAVAGSSRELLEARVVKGVYPPGYHAKRATEAMPKFPNLASEMDALAAYLGPADLSSRD